MRLCTWGAVARLVWLTAVILGSARTAALELKLPMRLIYQFEGPTYIQGLAIGSNGDLVMSTVFPNASLYHVTGAATDHADVNRVYTFDDLNVTSGLVETSPGVFHFLAGRQRPLIGMGIPGSFGLYQLDIRPEEPVVEKVLHMPDAGFLIDVQRLPGAPSVLLISDCTDGAVWRVDLRTRESVIAAKSPLMMPPAWAPVPFGISGIGVYDGYLYWNHAYHTTVYRIKITADGFPVPGATNELIASPRTLFLDHFVVGPKGQEHLWMTFNAINEVAVQSREGNLTVVSGAPDEMTAAGPTSLVFGTLPRDLNTLYVSTNGGLVNPVNGSLIEGGKLFALDTRIYLENHSSHKSGPVHIELV